jgi:hypothetical protein
MVRLDSGLDEDAQRRMFSRLKGDLATDMSVMRTGAEIERMVREAGMRAVRRLVECSI